MSENLFSLIRSRMPDGVKPFLSTPEGGVTTYEGMMEETGQFAQVLRSLGVVPGDRVAVQVEKSPQAVMLYLACLRAGAVFLPLNTAYTLAELDYFISDAKPKLVVCSPSSRTAVATLADRVGAVTETLGANNDGSLLEKRSAVSAEFADVARGRDDLAAILYTSGTTGRSKGAMLTHGNLSSNALALMKFWHFTSQDVLLHALPIYHAHGLFVAINTVLLCGGSIVFLPKFDIDEVFRLLPQTTTMMGVPTFYVRLADDSRLTREATSHMRLFISGSAPLLAETHRLFAKKTGHAILERYGMTETGMNTSNPYEGDRVPGSVGFPLPGVSLRIADRETGAVLPEDQTGMIEVKGPNVFAGYWQMPEKTGSEFRPDGFFITGDLGRVDKRGYVHIVGRGKDLVISGGFNVYPKEVESEIDAIAGVSESAVIGVPHKDFGEGVTAVVVLQQGAKISERQVLDMLAARLAKFKMPKKVIFVEELPRNAMGKVQKNILRETYKDYLQLDLFLAVQIVAFFIDLGSAGRS